jgi:hypothetical protein
VKQHEYKFRGCTGSSVARLLARLAAMPALAWLNEGCRAPGCNALASVQSAGVRPGRAAETGANRPTRFSVILWDEGQGRQYFGRAAPAVAG